MPTVVVSYDISDDKRRTKVWKLLKNYGQWMQFSLFECRVTDKDLVELRHELMNRIKRDEDSIRIYPLCQACLRSVERIGGEKVREDGPIII
jgi:CRISPR-associated protein Cas2